LRIENDLGKIDTLDLERNKRERILNKEFWDIVKGIIGFSAFLVFLFIVAYSNLTASSILCNQMYQNTFVNAQNSEEMDLNNVNKNYFVFRLFMIGRYK
jgi:hypothetical protein